MILVIVFELLIMLLIMNKIEIKGYVRGLKKNTYIDKFTNKETMFADFKLQVVYSNGKQQYIPCKTFKNHLATILAESDCIELTSYMYKVSKYLDKWYSYLDVYEVEQTTLHKDNKQNANVDFVSMINNDLQDTPRQDIIEPQAPQEEKMSAEELEMELEKLTNERQEQLEMFDMDASGTVDWKSFLENQDKEFKEQGDIDLEVIEVVDKQEKE